MEFVLNTIFWTLALYGLFEIIKNIIYISTYTKMKSDGIYLIIAVKNQEEKIEGFLRSIIFKILYGKEDWIKNIIVDDLKSDDSTIEIGQERFLAPEILFNPLLREYEYPGIPEVLSESINKTNVDLKLQLYSSILLSGGNTKIKGLKERIYREIKKLAPKNAKVRLHTPSNPEYCSWIGANIISSLEIAKEMWISLKDWMEKGDIIHTRTI